ncbi:HTH-type transcriptional regulator YodB [compost metagenome]
MENLEQAQETVCARFRWAIEIIGRRWSGAVLHSLFQQPRRFCEIRERIPEISDRMLTERLKELEQLGIVVREAEAGRPGHASYRLTPKGEALRPVMDQIQAWAEAWHDDALEDPQPPR